MQGEASAVRFIIGLNPKILIHLEPSLHSSSKHGAG